MHDFVININQKLFSNDKCSSNNDDNNNSDGHHLNAGITNMLSYCFVSVLISLNKLNGACELHVLVVVIFSNNVL